jgi:hypothetical protein
MNDFDDLEYKPTNFLLDYLDIVDFHKKRKKIIDDEEEEEEEEISESEDKDLNALYEIVMDFKHIRDSIINHCDLEPKLFTSTFTGSMVQEENKDRKKKESIDYEIDRQVNDIMKNQLYKNIVKDKINKKKIIDLQKKNTAESYSAEKATQINSSIADIENIGNIKKTNSIMNYSGINLSFIKKLNTRYQNLDEIIVVKKNSKSTKKTVKLILVDHYIFYFITFNQISFLHKKIIPIVNLYIHKKKLNNTTELTFISQSHNNLIKKEFYCDNYELVNKFVLKFNEINFIRDITK